MENIFTIKNILIYLVLINLISFIAMYIDKKRAKWGKWRIKESTLFLLCLIGGSIGGIAGMYTFRHKTKKRAAKYRIVCRSFLFLYNFSTAYM